MIHEAVRRLIEKRPFEPFEVQWSSGQTYGVSHSENAHAAQNTLDIGDPDADSVIWCSLIHVAAIRGQQKIAGPGACPASEG
jgi:hypothetical protein